MVVCKFNNTDDAQSLLKDGATVDLRILEGATMVMLASLKF